MPQNASVVSLWNTLGSCNLEYFNQDRNKHLIPWKVSLLNRNWDSNGRKWQKITTSQTTKNILSTRLYCTNVQSLLTLKFRPPHFSSLLKVHAWQITNMQREPKFCFQCLIAKAEILQLDVFSKLFIPGANAMPKYFQQLHNLFFLLQMHTVRPRKIKMTRCFDVYYVFYLFIIMFTEVSIVCWFMK